jgi:hypothetical protein
MCYALHHTYKLLYIFESEFFKNQYNYLIAFNYTSLLVKNSHCNVHFGPVHHTFGSVVYLSVCD